MGYQSEPDHKSFNILTSAATHEQKMKEKLLCNNMFLRGREFVM